MSDSRRIKQYVVVPRGLEPRTLRLLAVRSNQLSYRTSDCDLHLDDLKHIQMSLVQKFN